MKDSSGNEAAEVTRTVIVRAKMGPDWGRVVVYTNVPATVMAQVSVEGEAAGGSSVVGAYVGEELRGRQEVVLAGGRSYVTLNVSLAAAENVSFRIWEAVTGKEYDLKRTMTLDLGGTYGSAEALVELDFGGEGDTESPVIELLGEAQVVVELGSEYEDAGAKATDGVDGDLSGLIVVEGEVNTAEVGEYRLSYRVKDSSGNQADKVTRLVVVDPFGIPVEYENKWATVLGQVIINGASAGEGDVVGIYVGDELRGKLEIQLIGGNAWLSNARIHSAGIEETVHFKVYDKSVGVIVGKSGTRAVIKPGKVVGRFNEPFLIQMDTLAPVIDLQGKPEVTVEVGSEYVETGVRVSDRVDGDLSGSIVVVSNVDTTKPGTYRVSYNVRDSAGNAAAEVVRVVVVKPRLEEEILSLEVAQRQPLAFKFMAQIGMIYDVEVSEDLQKWIKLKEINGNGEIMQFNDDRNINENAQFYRLKIQ